MGKPTTSQIVKACGGLPFVLGEIVTRKNVEYVLCEYVIKHYQFNAYFTIDRFVLTRFWCRFVAVDADRISVEKYLKCFPLIKEKQTKEFTGTGRYVHDGRFPLLASTQAPYGGVVTTEGFAKALGMERVPYEPVTFPSWILSGK